MFKKLYEGHEVVAGYLDPISDPDIFVVSFTEALAPSYKLGADGVEWNEYSKGFGESLFIKYQINSVCIVAKWNHWWHTLEMIDVVESIKKLPSYQKASQCICYGSSMGAYGALKFAQLLNADTMIIAGPRIDPSQPNKGNPYCNLQRDKALWDVRSSLSSFEGDLHCFYDSEWERDKNEFNKIADCCRVIGHDIVHSGHHPLERLEQLGCFSKVVINLFRNKSIDDTLAEANRLSHKSYEDDLLRTMERALEKGQDADKYRELALCFEPVNRDISRFFIEKALKLRPRGEYIQKILKRLRD